MVAVLGPTASGKSDFAERLALSRSGELVSADASAIYRELSVGVTKPDKKTRERIPYHLIDVSDLSEAITMADYQKLALETIASIHERGRLPILVGGSSLYVRALLEGYCPPPIAVPIEVRNRVRELGFEQCLAELEKNDPAFLARIDTKNPRRVTRALELVYACEGVVPPPTSLPPKHLAVIRFVLMPEKEVLDRRILKRTRAIWGDWRKEVLALEKKGLDSWLKLRKPIGYAAVGDELRGRLTQQQAIDEVVRATRLLAKKQRTWLQKDRDCSDRYVFQLVDDADWSESIHAKALALLDEFLERFAQR